MKKVQQGFTLIELMIVVAIIGILAAVAIPAYQDYTIRAQVGEGPTMAAKLKTAMSEYFADKGAWPTLTQIYGAGNPGAAAADHSGNYVSSMNINGGAIDITYGNNANATIAGQILTIRPSPANSGDIAWVCAGATDPNGAAVGADSTTIPQKYLPASCK